MASVAQLPLQQSHSEINLNAPPAPRQDTLRPKTSASETPPAHTWLQSLRRPKSSHSSKPSTLKKRRPLDELRRDSALVSASPTASAHSTGQDEIPSIPKQSLNSAPVVEVPTIIVHGEQPTPTTEEATSDLTRNLPPSTIPAGGSSAQSVNGNFRGIMTDIPSGGFDELTSPDNVQFSKRGTMLLDGQRVNQMFNSQVEGNGEIRTQPTPRLNVPSGRTSRVLSADDETLSQKVRSMYDAGGETVLDLTAETVVEEDEGEIEPSRGSLTPTENKAVPRTPTISNRGQNLSVRQTYEVAGGIEDWEDVEDGGVDRYGFILPKKAESRASNNSPSAFDSPGQHRVTPALLEASSSPRRIRSIRRSPSAARSSRSAVTGGLGSGMQKSPASIYSYRSNNSLSQATGTIRYATNRLPYNKNRRWMDEAGDMLTLPPGLAQLAEQNDDGKVAMVLKKKEWEREEKWRKMGRTGNLSTKGGGMLFDFDPKDPKVISRTWKGIPDRWRASAWYSFLAASAKRHKESLKDDELIQEFHRLQEENSADDVQIDCDVPRTINSHIMFRRRYRGGQRLLFRVLHALSLFFPETGYVQGMAAITATLLCYYDEEHAFIMTARLWQLRGLQRLYQDGFDGLMEALDDFKLNWLRNGEVAHKLVGSVQETLRRIRANTLNQDELVIPPTSYGTRWYLTLFNYSIPFPAQLRVWDVFMLLGDVSNSVDPKTAFGADLDVLHATSAALIDATREILLDSDFENAMKVLTSWIPVKDEDLLMKVAYAEWKLRKKRS